MCRRLLGRTFLIAAVETCGPRRLRRTFLITAVKSVRVELAASARLVIEECEGSGGEQRRGKDVVVGQARQDRQRVATLWPTLAHPAAVAEAAVEQLENLHVVAG